jgi:hypothetical protein
MDVFTIRTESDFLMAANLALTGKLDFAAGVRFEGWPSLTLNVKGKRYNKTLPTNAMAGLLGLQEAYNRAYAIVKYGTTNLQRLTEAEKSDLEFVFEVTEGSTNNQAPTDGWLNSFIENVGNVMTSMDSVHKQKVLITCILVAGGYFLGSDIIDANKSQNSDTQTVALVKEVNAGHAQTIESLLQLQGSQTDSIKSVVNQGQLGFVKSVADANSIEIANVTIDKKAISKIVKTEKVAKNRVERDSVFLIDGFKRSQEYLLFSITDTKTEESYSLKVDIGFTSEEELDLIFVAMRDGKDIRLSVEVVLKGNIIERGRLIRVISN